MKKRVFGGILAIALAFGIMTPRASALKFEDWQTADGAYGFVVKADDNITNLKGAKVLNADNSHAGPYTKVSTQTVADGIKEEAYIEIDPETMDAGEKFTLTLALDDTSNNYTDEILVLAYKTNQNTVKLQLGLDNAFSYEIEEAGVYTFCYEVEKAEDGKVNGKFTILLWDEELASTNVLDLNEDSVKVRYIWFSDVSVADGLNVYTELPEKPTVGPDRENPSEESEKNPDTSDNVALYIALAFMGLSAVGATTKSLLKTIN